MKKLSLALIALLVVSVVKAEGEEAKGFLTNIMGCVASAKDAVINSTGVKFVTESYKDHLAPFISSVASVIADTPTKQYALVATSTAVVLGSTYLVSQKIKNNTYRLAFVGTVSALAVAAAGYFGYGIYSAPVAQ